MINIRYASIRELDISNGEGIGIALFVQGCHFHCQNCFNSDTWDFNGGKEWTQEVEDKFIELANKPYIKRISILGGEPLAEENLNDTAHLVCRINETYNTPQHIDDTNDNNHNILIKNPDKIRISYPQKTIWLYTGYTWGELFMYDDEINKFPNYLRKDKMEFHTKRQQIIKQCNVVVDGRYIDSQRDITLKWRGSSNQRVIDVQESLRKGEVVLWTN